MASSSGIDKSLFGTGYLTDAEKSSTFIFHSDDIKFDEKQGIGGATPVQGYNGPWPIFSQSDDTWADIDESGPSEVSSKSAKMNAPRMVCKSTGRCSACPKKEVRHAMMYCLENIPTDLTTLQRNRPYCLPYGNSAPVECRPITTLEVSQKPASSTSRFKSSKNVTDKTKSGKMVGTLKRGNQVDERAIQMWSRQGEPVISSVVYKGYQTCGRDQIQEVWDYSEFIVSAEKKQKEFSELARLNLIALRHLSFLQGVNLLVALAGLFLLVRRQRLLAGQHQAMLARRIGRI